MTKIAFWTPQIDVRGSCDAVYNYADQNEKLLDGKSLIIIPDTGNNEPEAMEKFTKRFQIFYHSSLEEMDEILLREKCEILYLIKYGKNDGIISKKIPNAIHCVFDLSEPHGEAYAAVSEQLAKKYNMDTFVPHMITIKPGILDGDLRSSLGIKNNAIVIGRYGGMDTFNLEFVKKCISSIVENRNDIYFLFGNTPEFYIHPQIIHVPRFSDMSYKKKFIRTCDAYIEASTLGHTFGLAQGEFSVFNKPLIIYGGPVWNDNHRKIINNNGIHFYNETDLYTIITTFDKKKYKGKDLNYYKKFSPLTVMLKFKEVFIMPLISD